MVDSSAVECDALRKELEKALERQQKVESSLQKVQQKTTFDEYIAACHSLLSLPLKAAPPFRSTKGTIPAPTGKFCPTRLREWTSFPTLQADVYDIVRHHLQPAEKGAPRLFSPILALEDRGQSLCSRPISSENDLEKMWYICTDGPIQDIVSALCQIPKACEELHLGDGIRFVSHENALDQETSDAFIPDLFCVHRLSDSANVLLTTVEYKPPHKLSVENLRAGLRSMDFWEEIVNSETVPIDEPEKLRYNAAQLTGAVLAQAYHLMIQEGLAYSYVSTGIALVFLYVSETEPNTLQYYLCVPSKDVPSESERYSQQPLTAVARVLCLCLISCATSVRTNEWRNKVKSVAHTWEIDFDYARSQIPTDQLRKTPPDSI